MPTEPWAQPPALVRLGVVAHALHPSTQKVETGVSEVQGDPWLGSKFKVTVGHARGPYLKKGKGKGWGGKRRRWEPARERRGYS